MAMVCLFTTIAVGQTKKTVSGTVRDDSGTPLPGVSIHEKSNKAGGVASDSDGKFSITVGDNAVLVFSFVGFATREVEVGSNPTIAV